MNKIARILGLCFCTAALLASPALAQTGGAGTGGTGPAVTTPSTIEATQLSGAVGAGLVCIGSAYGIGRLRRARP